MRIAIWSLFLLAGCFNPHYVDGSFLCDTATKRCPSGQSCINGKCYSAGQDGGGIDRRDGGDADAVVDTPMETPIEAPPIGGWELGHTCNQYNIGTSQRYDNCNSSLGLVCVYGDYKVAYCHPRCTEEALGTTSGCAPSTCERRVIEIGATPTPICGWLPADCNPTDGTGCLTDRICYLQVQEPSDFTICESASGGGRRLDACTYPRQCLPTFTCAEGQCTPACKPGVTDCPGGNDCIVKPGAEYGYCPPG